MRHLGQSGVPLAARSTLLPLGELCTHVEVNFLTPRSFLLPRMTRSVRCVRRQGMYGRKRVTDVERDTVHVRGGGGRDD